MDESDKDYEDELSKRSREYLVKLGLLVLINLHVCVNAARVTGPVSKITKLVGQPRVVYGYQNDHSDRHCQKDAIVDDTIHPVTELLAAAAEENAVANHVDELCTTEGTGNDPDCLVELGGIRFHILHLFEHIICFSDRLVTVDVVLKSGPSPKIVIKLALDLVRLGQVCRVGRH